MGSIGYEGSETTMFSWFKRKAPEDTTTLLVRQAVGGQSVLYRLFRDALGVPEPRIDKLELTYFTASVLTFTYLLVRKPPNPAAAINSFTEQFLRLAADHNQQTFEEVAREYQHRYRDYLALIPEVLRRENAGTNVHAEALLHQLYESVAGESARGLMLATVTGTRLVAQFVVDSVDFMRNGLPQIEQGPPAPVGAPNVGVSDVPSSSSMDFVEGDLKRLAPILFPGGQSAFQLPVSPSCHHRRQNLSAHQQRTLSLQQMIVRDPTTRDTGVLRSQHAQKVKGRS